MTFPSLLHRLALAVTLLSSGACTVVGYPAGTPGPAPARGEATPVRVAGRLPHNPVSDAGRTYEVFGVTYQVLHTAQGYEQTGEASWYGEPFHGRPTASGETFDMHGFSAAHRTLPLHTWVQVTNLDNGRSLIVRVNDRGPFARTERRILDLSYGAARDLGVVGPGVARVQVRALSSEEVAALR